MLSQQYNSIAKQWFFEEKKKKKAVATVPQISYTLTNQVDLSNCSAAYSLRAVNVSYLGNPCLDVTRSDNATCSVYTDCARNVFKITYGGTTVYGPTAFSDWAGASTLTVVKLYDQTGNNRHLDSVNISGKTYPTTTAALDKIVFTGSQNIERLDSTGTNLPLTVGTDEYTMVCVHKVTTLTAGYYQDAMSLTNTTTASSTSTRASLLYVQTNAWGFAGHGNDCTTFTPSSINTMYRLVMCVNNNTGTNNINAYRNGSLFSGLTTTKTNLNLKPYITALGSCGSSYSSTGEYFKGEIYEAFIYNTDLNLSANSAKLTALNTSLAGMYP